MIGIIRLAVFGFIGLSVLYFLLAIYSRSLRREKLEKEWEAEVKTGDRNDYVDAGLKKYEGSLRRKLIVLVFVIPIVVVGALLYFTNFN